MYYALFSFSGYLISDSGSNSFVFAIFQMLSTNLKVDYVASADRFAKLSRRLRPNVIPESLVSAAPRLFFIFLEKCGFRKPFRRQARRCAEMDTNWIV